MEIKIDKKYDTAKYFKRFIRLPYVIYEVPTEQEIDIEDNKKYDEQFTNEIIREFTPSSKSSYIIDVYIYSIVAAFFGLLMPIAGTIFEKGLMYLWVYVIYVLISLFFIRITYYYWKKYQVAPELAHITFDRMNQMIVLPRAGEFEYFKIPFKQLRVSIEGVGGSVMSYMGKHLIFYRGYSMNLIKMHSAKLMMGGFPNNPKQDWSFYVWYMDKNRPLPPGLAFDAYREVDFERRKKAGFPPPLFKSLVPTPEASQEQQLLRETFWKDEDYIATKKESHFSLWRK